MNTRNALFLLISFPLVIVFTFFMCIQKQTEEQIPEKKLTSATDTVIQARITSVTGQADLLRRGRNEWLQTKAGTHVSSGDIIRTAQESRVVINMLGYGFITIAEQSLISISIRLLPDNTEYAACNLKHGSLLVNILKLITTRRRFVVRTQTAVAAIRGTSFKTYVDQNTGESVVQVLRGQVGVKKRSFKKIKRRKIVMDHSLTQKVLLPTENLSATDIASVMNDLDQDWELELEVKAQKKIAAVKKKIEKKAESQNLSSEEIEVKIKKEQERIEQKLQAMTGGQTKETVVVRGAGVSVIDEGVTAPEEFTSVEIASMTREFSEETVEEALSPQAPSDDTQEKRDLPPNTPPQFISKPPQTAQYNEALEYQIFVEDDNPAGLFYNLQQAPEGMNIGSISGTVTWTPTDTGEYQVVAEVRDIGGLNNTQSFTIDVNHPVEEPVQPLPRKQLIKKQPVEQKSAIGTSLQKETKQTDDKNATYSLSSKRWFQKGYKTKGLKLKVEYFTKAISFDPNYVLAYNCRGNAYRKLKRYDKAIKDFSKAISIDPNYAGAYYNRGMAYDDLKQYDKAIKYYNMYLKLCSDKNGYWAKEARRIIKKLGGTPKY